MYVVWRCHLRTSSSDAAKDAADRERARQRFARLSGEYDARLKGRPPRDPYEGTLDPVSEADQLRALGFMVVAKLATIFVPIAGLAAVVVARSS